MKAKDIIVVVFITLIVIFFPFCLNGCLLHAPLFPIVGDETNWLVFWGSYVAAISSFCVAIVAIRQNKLIRKQNENVIKFNHKYSQYKELEQTINDINFVFSIDRLKEIVLIANGKGILAAIQEQQQITHKIEVLSFAMHKFQLNSNSHVLSYLKNLNEVTAQLQNLAELLGNILHYGLNNNYDLRTLDQQFIDFQNSINLDLADIASVIFGYSQYIEMQYNSTIENYNAMRSEGLEMLKEEWQTNIECNPIFLINN